MTQERKRVEVAMTQDLKAPYRPMMRPVRDNSDVVLATILIGLFLLVAVCFFAWRAHVAQTQLSSAQQRLEATQAARQSDVQPPRRTAPGPVVDLAPPDLSTGPSASDGSRYNSLRDYCYRMSEMNAQGEYPAFQKTACGDFARFAQSKGWGTGDLPEVRVKQTDTASNYPQSRTRGSQVDQPPAQCELLESEKKNINARMRQLYSAQEGEFYRARLRQIDQSMWDLNCRNH